LATYDPVRSDHPPIYQYSALKRAKEKEEPGGRLTDKPSSDEYDLSFLLQRCLRRPGGSSVAFELRFEVDRVEGRGGWTEEVGGGGGGRRSGGCMTQGGRCRDEHDGGQVCSCVFATV
jgi:hypothetical protein